MLSAEALLTTENTVLQSMSPPDDALKIPASVSAAVASPAAQVHTYAIALAVTVVDVKVFLSFSVTKAVCDAAAVVVAVTRGPSPRWCLRPRRWIGRPRASDRATRLVRQRQRLDCSLPSSFNSFIVPSR